MSDPFATVSFGHENEAIRGCRQRLAEVRAALGPRHPDYAAALNQLALLLIMQGSAEAAEPLLREALDVRRVTLGASHPEVATNLSSLGGILWARGDLAGAEPLLRQAAEIRAEALGPNHPKSVVSQKSLEQLLRSQRDWEAECLARMQSSRASAGPTDDPAVSHPTATSLVPDPRRSVPPPATVSTQLPVAAERPHSPAPRPPEVAHGVQQAEELSALLSTVTSQFEALSTALAGAGRALASEGRVPPETLPRVCGEALTLFRQVETRVSAWAQELGVPLPAGGLTALDPLSALAEACRRAERERAEAAEWSGKARCILRDVGRLVCPAQPDLGPLRDCLGQAKALHDALAAAHTVGPSLADLVRSLAAGEHPFACLVRLADAGDSTSDADWAQWYETVGDAFGLPLAVAVGRGRVTLGPAD